jgi:hypothetical protein
LKDVIGDVVDLLLLGLHCQAQEFLGEIVRIN